MSWVAVAVGVGSAAAGAYGANQQKKAVEKGNKGAGKVDITRNTDPWAPSRDHRVDIMGRASDLEKARRTDAVPGRRDMPRNNIPGTRTPPGYDAGGGKGKKKKGQQAASGGGGGGNGGGGGGGGQAAGEGSGIYGGGWGDIWGQGGGWEGVSETGGWEGSASSGRTNDLADAMAKRATDGHALYDPANEYVTDTLAGEDRNAYRGEAADKFRNLEDANLQRYMDMLFKELDGGGEYQGPSGKNGYGYISSGGGGGAGGGGGQGPAFAPPVGAAEEIKAILAGKYLNEGNPYRDELIDSISKRTRQEFNEEVMPGINSGFAGAGRFGSNAWQEAMAKGAGRMTDSLGGTIAQVQSDDYNARMNDVMGALGMGTQYDMAAMDDQTKRYIAAQDAAARSGAAGSAAASAASEQALREKLGLLSNLGGAVGLSAGLTQAGAQGLADVGADYGQDQRFALGNVEGLSGMGLRDLGAAGGFSLDVDSLDAQDRAASADNQLGWGTLAADDRARQAADQLGRAGLQSDDYSRQAGARLGWADMQSQDRARRSAAANASNSLSMQERLAQQQMQFDQYRFTEGMDWDKAQFGANMDFAKYQYGDQADWTRYVYGDQRPWEDLNSQADLVNAMSGGYGTVTEQGFDGRSQSMQQAPNVWQQALAGGIAGYGMASGYGGGGGGNAATSGGGSNYKGYTKGGW